MGKKIFFDKFEAAVLLNYYLKSENKELSRSEAIEKASLTLRRLAINRGIEIDDVFRNVAGIKFQMMSMESAYKGVTSIKPATKLFQEIVKMYKEDREQFDKILNEAEKLSV